MIKKSRWFLRFSIKMNISCGSSYKSFTLKYEKRIGIFDLEKLFISN